MMGLAVLTDLHTSITGELAKLELLSLSYNFLSSLPPTLPNLSFLRCLRSETNKTCQHSLFRELKMSGNKLQEFPLEVTFLPNLQLLDLSLNQASVPVIF